MDPDLCIVIVSYNTCELLRQCLATLHEVLPVRDPCCEVWVVDNASHDGSPRMVRAHFPAVRLIENETNVGFARANNQVLVLRRGRYVLLLNSDALVQAEAIERMYRFMEGHPRAGVVGPRLFNGDGSLQPSWAAFPTLTSELLGRERRPYRILPLPHGGVAWQVDWVGGSCLMARREAIDAVGLLDPQFFMYAEETDWCRRMRAYGWLCYYLPEAEVVHLGGGSTGADALPLLVQLHRSKLLYFYKHHGRLQAGLLRAGLVVRLAAHGILGSLGWRLGTRTASPTDRLALARETALLEVDGG